MIRFGDQSVLITRMKSTCAKNGPHFLIICSPILIAAKKFSIYIFDDRMDNKFETISGKLSKD